MVWYRYVYTTQHYSSFSSPSFFFVFFATKSNASVPRMYNANKIDGPRTKPPGANAYPHQASFSMYAKSDSSIGCLTISLGKTPKS